MINRIALHKQEIEVPGGSPHVVLSHDFDTMAIAGVTLLHKEHNGTLTHCIIGWAVLNEHEIKLEFAQAPAPGDYLAVVSG